MFFRRPTHQRFEYLPRFYDPEKDSAEEFKRKFKRERSLHRRKSRPILWWLVVIALAVYAYLYLAGVIR
ncbi:MAG: hypothetical protein WEB37_12860 [Bacteroidota bacterium]